MSARLTSSRASVVNRAGVDVKVTVAAQPTDGDPNQIQGRTDPLGEFFAVRGDQPGDLRPDHTTPQQGHPQGILVLLRLSRQ